MVPILYIHNTVDVSTQVQAGLWWFRNLRQWRMYLRGDAVHLRRYHVLNWDDMTLHVYISVCQSQFYVDCKALILREDKWILAIVITKSDDVCKTISVKKNPTKCTILLVSVATNLIKWHATSITLLGGNVVKMENTQLHHPSFIYYFPAWQHLTHFYHNNPLISLFHKAYIHVLFYIWKHETGLFYSILLHKLTGYSNLAQKCQILYETCAARCTKCSNLRPQ